MHVIWVALILCISTMVTANVPLTEAVGSGPPIPGAPKLNASGYILIDARNGEVLVDRNAEEPLPPASLTKMMTAYIAEREIAAGRADIEDMVPISVKAWKTGGSRMFVREGTEVRLGDLMRGIIVQSGNDASVAVAEHLAGSEDVFADVMNQTAQSLGMTKSVFKNATGLPAEGHVSTAKDLAILASRIIKDFPEKYAIYKEKTFIYNGIKQSNRNSLLFRDPSVDGLKTGHTEEAGYCLVASATRDGFRLISVVMGTAGEKAREQETSKLLQYGFRYFSGKMLYDANEVLPSSERKVWFGQLDSIQLVTENPLYVTLPLGRESSIKAVLDAPDILEAPLALGQMVGNIKIMLGERVLAKSDVLVETAVLEAGFFKKSVDFVLRFFE